MNPVSRRFRFPRLSQLAALPAAVLFAPLAQAQGLPTIEDPSRGQGSGILQTLQNYGYDIVLLIALLVCLIPTTIGALLSAIGIAGMDRLVRFNVLAMSGRAVEAAGDIDVLLLDKTGTITFGNRMASEFIAVQGVTEIEAAHIAVKASRADETAEGIGEVVQGQAVGRLDVGHEQTARGGRGDPEVDVAVEDDLLGLVVPAGIGLRVTTKGEGQRLGHEEQRGDLDVGEAPVALEPVDEVHHRRDVHGDELGDVRRGEGRGHHRLGRRPAHALDRDASLLGSDVAHVP